MTKFRALWIEEQGKHFNRKIIEREIKEPLRNHILIQVHYSGLNYKDALSSIGNKGVTKKYPHTPGIDAAGIVLESSGDRFSKGEEVIVTGYDLGMNTCGGFGEIIHVPLEWVVKKPNHLSLRECMLMGTAGFTAAQSLFRLQRNEVFVEKGPVLVTGATGAVGSGAIALLKKAGYEVAALTRSGKNEPFLKSLGASEAILLDDFEKESERPMLKGKWAGVIDTVGGKVLEVALKSTSHRAAVACCGLVGSASLNLTVFPFILRGVQLCGIDSAECPMEMRLKIWEKLNSEWKYQLPEEFIQEITLEQTPEFLDLMLKGDTRGKVLLKHNF